MSTLKVGTIQNAAGVTQYLCKAWVTFDGTGTVSIRSSGNVSSITDNGVGDYTINFTNALVDASYTISGTCVSPGTMNNVLFAPYGALPTTTSVRVGTYNISTFQDSSYNSVVIHR